MDTADRLRLEIQLRQARRDEIERRVTAHNVEVHEIGAAVSVELRGVLRHDGRPWISWQSEISWFEYPLTDDGFITGFNQAIIGEVGTQLRSMGIPPSDYLELCSPGPVNDGNADLWTARTNIECANRSEHYPVEQWNYRRWHPSFCRRRRHSGEFVRNLSGLSWRRTR